MHSDADCSDEINNAVEILRQQVLVSPSLLNQLRATPDKKEFICETLRIATELKLKLTAADIENALQSARRECMERWS